MSLDNGIRLSLNFTVGEFAAVSGRPLQTADLPNMQALVNTVLQPLRRQFGTIRLTSYIRPADIGRAHASGRAVDFVPGTAPISTVFRFMGTNFASAIGRAIDERDHIHVTLPGPESWAGHGVFLNEPREGEYTFAEVSPIMLPLYTAAGSLAGAGTPLVSDLGGIVTAAPQAGPLLAGVEPGGMIGIVMTLGLFGAIVWALRANR